MSGSDNNTGSKIPFSPSMCKNYDLEEGWCKANMNWDSPMPEVKGCEGMCDDYAPKKKTADEMFRELGYEKVNNNRYIKIEDMGSKGLWTYTQIVVGEEETIKQTVCEPERSLYEKYLSASEILACAQLIREMGWADA